jgi:flavodoxin
MKRLTALFQKSSGKHLFSLVLMAVLLLTAVGCSGMNAQSSTGGTAGQTPKSAAPAGTTAAKGKTLVVYFSATGNTRKVAETIARTTGADLFEIKPAQPYTREDLNYRDENSRVQREHKNPSLRPAYTGDVQNWSQYDTVFVGFPHWWRQAPHVVYTFVEKHDFTGKTVIPFATSVQTPLGDSGKNLARAAGTGNWLEGKRFEGNVLNQEVMNWVQHLPLSKK